MSTPVAPVVPAAPAAPVVPAPVVAAPAAPAAAVTPVPVVPAPAAPAPAAGGLAASLGDPAAVPVVPAAPVIPESYEFAKPADYKGADSDVARVTALAKASGLTKEQAQKLFDADAATIAEQEAAVVREIAQARTDNIATLKADPEFGGAKYTESLTRADQALAVLDPKGELMAELKANGLEHHPLLVRTFMRAGRMMAEGNTFVQPTGQPAASKGATMSDVYPTMK